MSAICFWCNFELKSALIFQAVVNCSYLCVRLLNPVNRQAQDQVQDCSWCNPAADDPVAARSLCHSVSLPRPLCLSPNSSGHAKVSYLSQPLQSTLCPPPGGRTGSTSADLNINHNQSFSPFNLMPDCRINNINHKCISKFRGTIAHTGLESWKQLLPVTS